MARTLAKKMRKAQERKAEANGNPFGLSNEQMSKFKVISPSFSGLANFNSEMDGVYYDQKTRTPELDVFHNDLRAFSLMMAADLNDENAVISYLEYFLQRIKGVVFYSFDHDKDPMFLMTPTDENKEVLSFGYPDGLSDETVTEIRRIFLSIVEYAYFNPGEMYNYLD